MMIRSAIAALLAVGLAAPAEAAFLPAPIDQSAAPVVKIYGGCGPYGHRGPYGGCRPGGQWGGYWAGRPCPPGFHLGPYGRHCWAY
jgi:hypothetical protein